MPTLLGQQLSAAGRGDEVAAAAVYQAVAPRVHGIVVRILGDVPRSEELTREVFGRLWQSASEFDPARGSATAWVMGLAHRIAVDSLRSLPVPPPGHGSPVDEALGLLDEEGTTGAASMETRTVQWALAALRAPERHVLELAYFGGRTCADISRLVEASPATVQRGLRDALAGLRDMVSTGTGPA